MLRKVLLFIVLFGGGLAALYLLTLTDPDERRRRIAPPPETPAEDESTGVPAVRIPSDDEVVDVVIEGETRIVRTVGEEGLRRKMYDLHWMDTVPKGRDQEGQALFELVDLTMNVFNVDTGTLQLELASERSLVPIQLVGGEFRLGDEDRVTLNDTSAVLHEGMPIVPFTLKRVPDLEVNVYNGDFHTPDRVELEAPGVTCSGVGMDYRSEVGTFQVLRDADIEALLDPDTQTVAKLLTTGSGTAVLRERPDISAEALELLVTEGARLELRRLEEGAEAPARLVLTAERISVIGVGVQGAEDSFLPSAINARGDVVLTRGGEFFKSDRADLSFTASGELSQATLFGAPSGSVSLRDYVRDEAYRDVVAELEGVGPLVISLGTRPSFDFTGPCELRIPELDASILAQSSIRGSSSADSNSAELFARGAVEARFAGRELFTEELDVTAESVRRAGVEEPLMRVTSTSRGRTQVRASDPERGVLNLDADGGLVLRITGSDVRVPRATRVTLEVVEVDRRFTARAGEVVDFDLGAMTYEAAGGVEFETLEGRGSGDTATSRGPDEVLLTGTPESPAAFHMLPLEEGSEISAATASALSILLTPERVVATDQVTLTIEATDRRYDLRCAKAVADLGQPGPGGEQLFTFRAEGVERGRLVRGQGTAEMSSDWLEVHGVYRPEGPGEPQEGEPEPGLDTRSVTAGGAVTFDWKGRFEIRGTGEHLLLDRQGGGRLWNEDGRRIECSGRLPDSGLPYELTANWLEFTQDTLWAYQPIVRVERLELPIGPGVRSAERPTMVVAQAELLRADRGGVFLSGGTEVRGVDDAGAQWAVTGRHVLIEGEMRENPDGDPEPDPDTVRLSVWGSFVATHGTDFSAAGERLVATRSNVRIEGEPARLNAFPATWTADWIEYDAANLEVLSGSGEMSLELGALDAESNVSLPQQQKPPWRVRYESMRPFRRLDKTLLVLQSPVFFSGGREVHAAWALFWIDREEWRRAGGKLFDDEEPELRTGMRTPDEPTPQKTTLPNLFGEIDTSRIAHILNELYIEGNVELLQGDRRLARADALYVDLLDGHGWIQGADVTMEINIRDEPQKLRAKAEWLRHSRDGSLHADSATITSSTFEEPGYVIETRDLRLEPQPPGSDAAYEVTARKNSLRFENGFSVPFPAIEEVKTNEEGRPTFFEDLVLADTARFGAAVITSVKKEVSEPTRRIVSDTFKVNLDDVEGKERFRAAYLGSRGVLLGVGLELTVTDRFRMELYADGLRDTGRDRGLVRVDKDDRDPLRLWTRARARYLLDDAEWIDFAFTTQTDPGVQAEFYEKEYLTYEERNNYLHYRKARGSDYYEGTLRYRVDDYRTVVEELPTVGYYHGREKLGALGKQPLYYTATFDAGYLQRREGDPEFERQFVDGLGDRDVLRADTIHRLESPFDTEVAGITATPYVAGRGTAWDEGVDEDDTPGRASVFAGIDFSTRLWKSGRHGEYHEIVPTVGFRGDLATEESDGMPVYFDQTEIPLEGEFVDLGLRGRWWTERRRALLDVEVRTTHADDTAAGQEDGWLPIRMLAKWRTTIGGDPVGANFDGRFDPDDGRTLYSRTTFGWEPDPDLALEMGFSRASEEGQGALFEAASMAVLYRATRKWEIELSQTLSLLDDNDTLASGVAVRRIGRDFVVTFEFSEISGEGGSSFGVKFKPLLGYKREDLGYVRGLRLASQR